MNRYLLLIFSLVFLKIETQSQNALDTHAYYQHLKANHDVAGMNMFFKQLPKGGDLHHHFGGSLFVETYLEWLDRKNYQLDTQSLKAQSGPCENCVSIDSVYKNEALYEQVLERWSTQDYMHKAPARVPPDQHFFDTFYYFGGNGATWDYPEGLQNLKKRAIRENLLYIETQAMFSSFPIDLNSYNNSLLDIQKNQDTSALQKILLEMEEKILEKGIKTSIQGFVETFTSFHAGIDDEDFTLRYQAYIVRKFPPALVFSSLYAAFEAAKSSPLVVGVNIVAPEHGRVSMRDYWLHMQMFRFLSDKYPTVKKSLHAGELALSMVKPEDLTYHITDALFVAGADRIGHGIDIPYENQAIKSLEYMAKEGKAVEINLSSNEFILGVSGAAHPINLYHQFGVPIVLSTDDSGVSRNSLSNEYSLLGQRYNFNYAEIKQIVYNGIQYSFLSEKDKQENISRLNLRFEAFEKAMAGIYRDHVKK